MAQYLRQKGTQNIYAIVNGGAYYVPYDYALKNNVFSQVEDVPDRVDKQFLISGNINDAPKDTTEEQPQNQTVTPSSDSTPFDPVAHGTTMEVWNKLSQAQQALIESYYKVLGGQFDVGKVS